MWQLLPAQAASQSGLAGYWKFDEAIAGSTALDSSGNGNDLVPTNAPTPSTNIPGVMNGDIPDTHSVSFDGTTQYFSVADNSSLDTTDAVSVSTWVKFNSISGNQTIMAKWQVGVHQQWVLQLNSGHISWWTGDGWSGANELASTTAISSGTWYHLVATATSGSKKLYINGNLDVSNTAGAMGVATGTPLTVGSKQSDTGTYFEYLNGQIDDARLYTRALSDTEATALATGQEYNTLTGGSPLTNEAGTTGAITDLQIISTASNPTVPVKLLVSQGSLSMTTTTGLTFKDASGATLTNPQTGATLYFNGALGDVDAALATLHYTRTSGTGSDTLEASLVDPGQVFFPDNDHLYEYVSVPGGITWTTAKTAAEARSKYGAQGYLTTITSGNENSFVTARLGGAGWMGASDAASEGAWKWVTGPEAGTQFCSGDNPCNSVNSGYTNWNSGEPNDSGGNEDCGQFLAGGTGKWNDLPCTGTGSGTLTGYVVEYGGLGGINPTVSSKNVAITTVADATAPTAPGKPSVSPASPTTDTTPSLSWTASTDSGTGLANPAYTVQWSTSATFATVTGSSTTNSTSYTFSTALADGTWYFRIVVKDASNNTAISAISNALIIDTTAPAAPGAPTTTSPTNNTSPTWTWDAAVDSGAGIIAFGYTFEWSQAADFSSIAGAISVSPTSAQVSLGEGTWYTRVSAQDKVGHTSAWSAYGTVIIDTTVPASPYTSSPGGTYNATFPLKFYDADTDATGVYYTTDGSTPTNASTEYIGGSFPIDHTQTIKAAAHDAAGNLSSTISETYVIDPSANLPVATPAGGTYTTAQAVTLSVGSGTNTALDAIYYTLDGSTPDDSSTEYTGAITIGFSETLKAVAYDKAGNPSPVMSKTYIIAEPAPAPQGNDTETTASPSPGPASASRNTTNSSNSSATPPTTDISLDSDTPDQTDTVQLNNATEKPAQTDQKDSSGRKVNAFLGLGWWWLLVAVIIAFCWFLLAGKKRRRHGDEKA